MEGHNLRITKVADKVNDFALRIDNREFDDLTHGRSYQNEYAKKEVVNVSIKEEGSFDPFSDFASVAKPSQSSSSGFDDFDFD